MPVWYPNYSNTNQLHHSQAPVPTELQCDVSLEKQELWKQFRELDTEMIITKEGRNLFPTIAINISGLNPNLPYCILINVLLVGTNKLRYCSNGWTTSTNADAQSPHSYFIHPRSPATGSDWMSGKIDFKSLKLTNKIPTPNIPPKNGLVVLSSMHRYQPHIIIVQCDNTAHINNWANPRKIIVFPETQFVAVTAYQSEKVKDLKIANNAFARGFREDGRAAQNRKHRLELKQKPDELNCCNSPELDDSFIKERTSPLKEEKSEQNTVQNERKRTQSNCELEITEPSPKKSRTHSYLPKEKMLSSQITEHNIIKPAGHHYQIPHNSTKSTDISFLESHPFYRPPGNSPQRLIAAIDYPPQRILPPVDQRFYFTPPHLEQYQYPLPSTLYPHPSPLQVICSRPFNYTYPPIYSNYPYYPPPQPYFSYYPRLCSGANPQSSPQPGTEAHISTSSNAQRARTPIQSCNDDTAEEIDVVGDDNGSERLERTLISMTQQAETAPNSVPLDLRQRT